MDFSIHYSASEDEEPERTEEVADSDSPRNTTALAHRMIMFVFGRHAIDRDARTLAFWEEFRVLQDDVTWSAQELRDYFYGDLMKTAEDLDNVPYHVRQYINPMFNRYRGEVLRQQDSLDLCYSDQTGRYGVSATGSQFPAELLPIVPSWFSSTPAPTTSNSSTRLPTSQQVLRFVSDNISELLWTEDEKTTKVAFSTDEWLTRMATLTKNGISLIECAEPEMENYNRIRLLGLLSEDYAVTKLAQDEDMVEEGRHEIASSSDLEDFRTPIDNSTPLEPRSKMVLRRKHVPRTGTVPLADSGYDLSSFPGPTINSTPRHPPAPVKAEESAQRLAREERLRAMQNDNQQPCCSYR